MCSGDIYSLARRWRQFSVCYVLFVLLDFRIHSARSRGVGRQSRDKKARKTTNLGDRECFVAPRNEGGKGARDQPKNQVGVLFPIPSPFLYFLFSFHPSLKKKKETLHRATFYGSLGNRRIRGLCLHATRIRDLNAYYTRRNPTGTYSPPPCLALLLYFATLKEGNREEIKGRQPPRSGL